MNNQYTLYRIACLYAVYTLQIFGSAGTLDTSYGPNNTGVSIIAIGRSNDLQRIAVQADNSLIGVGTVTVLATATGICSFTSTGTFNAELNGIGYEQLAIGSTTVIQAIALQPDTKAVVAGSTMENGTNKFIIARYSINGLLDTTFGGSGYVTTDIGGGSSVYALVVQPDGKIVAGGIGGQGAPNFALARYNPNGSLDTTFGEQGIVRTTVGYISNIYALALQVDGKILAAGYCWNLETNICALARFNADGSLDTTFGIDGIVTTQVGNVSQLQTIALQQDGNIIVGGYTTNDRLHYSSLLMRYDSTGTLDPSFNGTGIVITTLTYSSVINALTLQSDGKIVTGGYDFGALNTTFALARYLPSGTLDTSFGTNGVTLTAIGDDARINSLIIQSDGKIVAAGTSDNKAALARYFA
jgi:uncharacterized delta-60 repeat protein